MTVKEFINNLISEVYDAGVDAGYDLKKLDDRVSERLRDISKPEQCVAEDEEEEVFGATRQDWEESRKNAAIACIFTKSI